MSQQLTVQVLGWNSAKELPETAMALAKLPADKVVVRYIDNASTDDSVAIVQQYVPHADILQLTTNEGFTGGHNRGLALCTTPFVLLHDPDVSVSWPALHELLEQFTNPKLAAVQGKLWRAERAETGERIIDSAGIELTRALNGRERGANEIDQGQWDTGGAVFAVTGACALYRMSALAEIAYSQDEIMDATFFAYKDDIDLGWRLRQAGWGVTYVPVTVGVHHRTLGRRGLLNWGLNPNNILRRLKSPRTRYSFRNWIWMFVKNGRVPQLALASPFITLRLTVFACLTIFYPPFSAVWLETVRGLAVALSRRQHTLTKSKKPR